MKTTKKTTYLLLFVIFYSLVFAGNPRLSTAASVIPEFYYYYTEKVYLSVSTEMITICFEETISKEQRKALITAETLLKDISDKPLPFGFVLSITKEGSSREAISQAIERLNKLSEVKYVTLVFESGKVKLVLMDRFVVRFKPDIKQVFNASMQYPNY